jgi:hypothetical protein
MNRGKGAAVSKQYWLMIMRRQSCHQSAETPIRKRGASVKSSAQRTLLPVPAIELPVTRVPRRTLIAIAMAVAATGLTGTRQTRAQSSTPEAEEAAATPEGAGRTQLLPRDTILPVETVQSIVPEIAHESSTGLNATVMGTPAANRAVTFSSADDSQHLVLSVDQYHTADEAKREFDTALEASKEVPGVTSESVSGLGDAALLGVVTQGDETHVGGGALLGNLIVNATLQSYEGTDENKQRVIELIRQQADHATMALGSGVSATPTA